MTASIRYIVDDVDAAIAFYSGVLGFQLDKHPAPGFAALSRGDLLLLLNRPGAGGAGASVGGQAPRPGGWNRFQIEVDDLEAMVEGLRSAGHRLRSEVIAGNGGKQVLVDDPSGNPVELFEPTPAGT